MTPSNKQPSIIFGRSNHKYIGIGKTLFQGIEDVFRGLEQLGEAIAAGLIIGALVLVAFVVIGGRSFGTITGSLYYRNSKGI